MKTWRITLLIEEPDSSYSACTGGDEVEADTLLEAITTWLMRKQAAGYEYALLERMVKKSDG